MRRLEQLRQRIIDHYENLPEEEKLERLRLRELNEQEVRAEFKVRVIVVAVLLGIAALTTYCPEVAW